jgi:hypothetical protein
MTKGKRKSAAKDSIEAGAPKDPGPWLLLVVFFVLVALNALLNLLTH